MLNSLGWVKCYACVEPDQAIAHFERAIRLSPRDPEMVQMLNGIALAHLIAGRNEEAWSSRNEVSMKCRDLHPRIARRLQP